MNKPFPFDHFTKRHIGIKNTDLPEMLDCIGVKSLNDLISETLPDNIFLSEGPKLPDPITESNYLQEIHEISRMNKVFKSYIGMGYYGTITPSVVRRNIFENPGWYTQYTPYQAEISHGRLEALLNFQTVVSDLTALPIANASLFDEGTAAAEAMSMFYAFKNKRAKQDKKDEFLVSDNIFPQTIDILKTRAKPFGIKIIISDWKNFEISDKTFGILLQYPGMDGLVEDFSPLIEKAKTGAIPVCVAADLLSLALLSPPGEWGADVVVGSSQRFGVPIGYGGPHAAYFATKESYKRLIPGRIIGLSVDTEGKPAYRMALQTREQHIRREKATSNICTAQALLAIMAGMYATYHGPEGIKDIAGSIHGLTQILNKNLEQLGYQQKNAHFFDTLQIEVNEEEKRKIRQVALSHRVNFYYGSENILISIGETTSIEDIKTIFKIFAEAKNVNSLVFDDNAPATNQFPTTLSRKSDYLTHETFNNYHSETEMMRYIKRLENRDLSLMHSMIPLGSCTMKLNAATQLLPVAWKHFGALHPFVPLDQAEGYRKIFTELENYLCEITGFAACSLQPNSGAQGEFSGLLTIRGYHEANGEGHRNIALIPASAHGTNPASAIMAGMKVVVVKCDENGNIDVEDLRIRASEHKDNLGALMVTYPSTHGVFETAIKEICDIMHKNGGLVYMDGANMNAMVGLSNPATIGADVCHLNLHKTFAIPHGGGGPGVGPICVNEKLKPFLPGHPLVETGGDKSIHAVSAAPWGSASILLISYAYIRMLGEEGLTHATKYAILNANYIKSRLKNGYEVLYTGERGRCAHELIIDLRPFKSLVSAEDVAKRLMDYGFHAPTLSFPVPGTIMIEPTESESKAELDRFCEAMLQIRKEIDEIASGKQDPSDNVLRNAPHSINAATADEWKHPYSREKALYPLPSLKISHKFWVPVSRIDNAYGDRHLVCTCGTPEEYVE